MNFLTLDVFLIIFIGMGPVKVLLLYIAATKDASPELQRKVARKAIMIAVVVGIVLLVAGVVFMRLLHFSRGALTIAGGLILLILALNLVLSPAQKEDHEAADEATLMSMAVYPLGIPMLLNPIGIAALTVFSAEAQTVVDLAVLLGMLLVVAVIDFGVFLVSHRLDNWLTHERVLVMEKVLGILLAALAVQLILAGLADVGVITLSGGH
jgi:multiple antibiotic resistance protein